MKLRLLYISGAIAYCSWPLAFWLNTTVARHDLASQLEAPHQPYNWLFVSLDIISGLLLSTACLAVGRNLHGRLLKIGAWCIGIFGLLEAGAAMVPLSCDPTYANCGPLINQPTILLHGFCSIASVIVLFAGAAMLYMRAQANRRLLGTLIFGWLLFSAGSLVELLLGIKNNALQYYFITLCSITVIIAFEAGRGIPVLNMLRKPGFEHSP